MISVQFEQGNASPRIVRITTNATLAQVTTAGWYSNQPPNQLVPSDEVEIAYAQGTTDANTAIFSVSISNGVVTLSVDSSSVVLPVVNTHLAAFAGTSGAIADSGLAPSAASQSYAVTSPGGFTVGQLVKFADANGTPASQGVSMKTVAGAAAAGGAAAQSFTDAFCTSSSCVIGNWNTQANAASVLKIVPGNGSFVVTSSADAGAGTFNYVIFK